MSAQTGIEWCDRTASPWYGCQHVSPACDHCYAESWAKRSGMVGWGPHADRRQSVSYRNQMLKWNREAEKAGVSYKVFASLCDPLDNAVPIEWFVDYLNVLRTTTSLTHLLLTKRIGNLGPRLATAALVCAETNDELRQWIVDWNSNGKPPANVWLGATVVNRPEMMRDAPKLKALPARVHFWSVEPMLGDLGEIPHGWLPEWVIAGGESGRHARPMRPDWVRSLRDQCAAAGVPWLFKQWGEWAPNYLTENGDRIESTMWMDRMGKKAAGRLLDGREHSEFPA